MSFRDYGIDLDDNFHGDRKTLCPNCSASRKKKNDPCLSVNGDKGTWHCFNCGWAGGLRNHDDNVLPANRKVYRRPDPEIVTPKIDPNVEKWFWEKRKISMMTLESVRIFSTMHYLNGPGKDILCMAFPYYQRGVLVNIKYRDGHKNMAQEKDPEPCLWNIDFCQEVENIYITEGEIDALTLIECGFPSAVSVDKGAPNVNDADASKKLECVTNCRETLDSADRVYLITDKDAPGLRLEAEIIKLLGPEKCYLTRYPDDCKDINDVLVKHGKDAVKKVIESAAPAPVPGLHDFSDFKSDIYNLYTKGHPKGLSTGWPELDENYTIQLGSVNVVTGIPQSGKSEWVQALVINMIKIHSWRGAIFSPEMMPPENLFANFAEKIAAKPFFGAAENRITTDELDRAFRMASDAIKVIIPDDDEMPTLKDLLTAAKVAVVRYNIKFFVIDPWNEIEPARPKDMTEHEYIGRALGMLRLFARRYKVWVCVVAHPTKLKKDDRAKEYPIPSLYDISGSSNWRNKVDNGISIWRSFCHPESPVQVHIQKVKNKWIGRNGRVNFNWDRMTGRYTPITNTTETIAPSSESPEPRYSYADDPPEPIQRELPYKDN